MANNLFGFVVRVQIADSTGRVLFVKPVGEPKYVYPTSWVEYGQAPDDAARLLVRQATGLEVTDLTPWRFLPATHLGQPQRLYLDYQCQLDSDATPSKPEERFGLTKWRDGQKIQDDASLAPDARGDFGSFLHTPKRYYLISGSEVR